MSNDTPNEQQLGPEQLSALQQAYSEITVAYLESMNRAATDAGTPATVWDVSYTLLSVASAIVQAPMLTRDEWAAVWDKTAHEFAEHARQTAQAQAQEHTGEQESGPEGVAIQNARRILGNG